MNRSGAKATSNPCLPAKGVILRADNDATRAIKRSTLAFSIDTKDMLEGVSSKALSPPSDLRAQLSHDEGWLDNHNI